LWGKLVAGLRVSSVLTLFLVWPVLLACVMVSSYWANILSVIAYLSIVLITCVTTAVIALFCSVVFKKTSMALMTTYLVIILLFAAPLAVNYFAQTFFPEHPNTPYIEQLGVSSPFSAADAVPLKMGLTAGERDGNLAAIERQERGNWPLYGGYVGFSLGLDAVLFVVMIWLFNTRWRVAG
jgi:ABC-type transport system involved in multi-copper enzyme maturation permease subunit